MLLNTIDPQIVNNELLNLVNKVLKYVVLILKNPPLSIEFVRKIPSFDISII